MADPSTAPPLTPSSIVAAHAKIKPHIHHTPLITSKSINAIASSRDPAAFLSDNPPPFDSATAESEDGVPRFRLWFKCENLQRIGAFKARGAFHALMRLIEEIGIEEVRRRGVVTHSSGNHAQALSLAASTFSIPSYIVMPSISTPSKIAGTRMHTRNVIFSGSTSDEREAVVAQVIAENNAILVPPYDHPDIILGQGTVGAEMAIQFQEACESGSGEVEKKKGLDVVITPLGGGGLLGGVSTFFSDSPHTLVFGAEPSFQGGDDGRRGLLQGKRIEHVKTLTIADGLRTPVGVINWKIVSDKTKVEGLYAVTEVEIKSAMRFVFERLKMVVEPSGCVGLAVVLFNKEFRTMVAAKQKGTKELWDVGIVFSGGNTTMKALSRLFADDGSEREEGKVGLDGSKKVEDVAG